MRAGQLSSLLIPKTGSDYGLFPVSAALGVSGPWRRVAPLQFTGRSSVTRFPTPPRVIKTRADKAPLSLLAAVSPRLEGGAPYDAEGG